MRFTHLGHYYHISSRLAIVQYISRSVDIFFIFLRIIVSLSPVVSVYVLSSCSSSHTPAGSSSVAAPSTGLLGVMAQILLLPGVTESRGFKLSDRGSRLLETSVPKMCWATLMTKHYIATITKINK